MTQAMRGLARRELLGIGAGAATLALLPRAVCAADADAAPPSVQAALMPRQVALAERWVGPGKFPGLVEALALPGLPTQYVARGTLGFADRAPIDADTLFRIYSMTKPITGMATMILIDEGKLKLDQPVAEILPKFAAMQVQDTYDGSLTAVHPAKAPITIRQLITHTSGLGYAIIQKGPLRAAMIERGVVAGEISRTPIAGLDRGKPAPSLAAFADRLAELPLVHEPGTTWSYSLGLDLMGRVIEVVAGQPFDAFLQARLLDPIGMTSTFFQVPKREAHRLSTNHGVVNGALVPIDPGDSSIFLDKPPYPMGGSGLVSSPRDYDRFLAMLGGYGAIDGRRVMSAAAVRMGTSDLLPPGVEGPALMGPRAGFGAGGRVGLGEEAGLFGWAGAAGTTASVHMRHGWRNGFYAQFMPPEDLPVLTEYREALKADLLALAARYGAVTQAPPR